MTKLHALASAVDLRGKIDAMFSGEHLNTTEDRAVLHVALRANRDQVSPPRRRGSHTHLLLSALLPAPMQRLAADVCAYIWVSCPAY